VYQVVYEAGVSEIHLLQGNSLEILPTLTMEIGAVVSDTPYGVMLGEVNNGQAREKNQQPYTMFSDTPEYVSDVVIPIIELCLQRYGRAVLKPGNRNMWKYPEPDDVGCWYVPAATSRSKWGFACMNPILYYGKSPRAGKGDTPNSIYKQAVKDKSIDHPCPIPLPVARWMVEKASLPGDTILDPFMGSGTFGVACVELGRNFVGIELEPKYFAIAERRITDAQMQMAMELPA
jgi:site-specific DNA-methyltransferase (adenine-specific)